VIMCCSCAALQGSAVLTKCINRCCIRDQLLKYQLLYWHQGSSNSNSILGVAVVPLWGSKQD